MLSAEQTISRLTYTILDHLFELYSANNVYNKGFVEGEKTAYVECLEIIQLYSKANSIGLSFNIEEVFPI